MPVSFPLSEASVIVANGSRDDAMVNHAELRAGFEERGFPSSITDAQLDVVIDAYGGGARGALDEDQLQLAMDERVIYQGADGRMRVDFTQREVSDALSRAIVVHGSTDDGSLNHAEIRQGLEALGFDVPMTERMAGVLIKAYGGPQSVVIDAPDLHRALDDGAIAIRDGAVALDFRSPVMAKPLALSIIEAGSRDDDLVNTGELKAGLQAVGFEPRIDDVALDGLITRYGAPALDADQLTDAITQGALALDGGGNLIAQAPPVYAAPIHPAIPFRDQVIGPEARPIDRELGMIADAVYDPATSRVGNWSRISDAELRSSGVDPSHVQDDSTSFKAGLYRNAEGQVTLAFAGTEGLTAAKDWWTNGKQGLGFDAKQYREAVELGAQARRAFGDNLVVTGHSLGGGLAATVALVHDIPAVTFNAAGVHDGTLTRNGLDPETAHQAASDGLVRRYVVEGEFLNYGQDHLPIPNAPGHLIALRDPAPLTWQQNLPPPVSTALRIAHSIQLHDMSYVFRALDQTPPWPTGPQAEPAIAAPVEDQLAA